MTQPKKDEEASRTTRFTYDAVNDVHFAYPHWQIETEEDCRVWVAQYEAYFSKLGRKVDVILVVDKFRIGPKVGRVWGAYRARLLEQFTRYSVRVHQDPRVSTFSATSSVLHGASNLEAPSIAAALTMIAELRRKSGA
jgi:hypothetical protein